MKRLFFIGVLGALGVALANRRRLPPERVDVYREDETLQTFEAGSDVADHVLPAARELLALTR